MQSLTIIKPDDFHAHFRDGDLLHRTVPDMASSFRRAVAMPNLSPPVTTIEAAQAYQKRIQAAIPKHQAFTPLMTLYLTDETTPELVTLAKQHHMLGFKFYPAHATTHAEFGVTNIKKLMPLFEKMEAVDLPLLIHGEVTDANVDVFDRETVFIEKILQPLIENFPKLRIVLEHITTEEAVNWVKAAPVTVAATITAHHLWINRNDLLVGGIHPHVYCLPVPKRQKHQAALIKAAISGSPKFFLGTDSALHLRSKKEAACGCAGIYTSFSALPLYLEIFEVVGALDKFENFASRFGAAFYQLPYNEEKITLVKSDWQVPDKLPAAGETVIPFKAGEILHWQIAASLV